MRVGLRLIIAARDCIRGAKSCSEGELGAPWAGKRSDAKSSRHKPLCVCKVSVVVLEQNRLKDIVQKKLEAPSLTRDAVLRSKSGAELAESAQRGRQQSSGSTISQERVPRSLRHERDFIIILGL